MQTFLSEHSFSATAQYLDDKRLNKQYLEVRQILEILLEKHESRWRNHPAVLQWKGFEYALFVYSKRIREECEERGISTEKNTVVLQRLYNEYLSGPDVNRDFPDWWEDEKLRERVIVTHRARLFIKKPEHYHMYETWTEAGAAATCCSHCNYFWPSHWKANGEKFLVTNKKKLK
jgi:hypothetical protein